jgi:hypothetical protein
LPSSQGLSDQAVRLCRIRCRCRPKTSLHQRGKQPFRSLFAPLFSLKEGDEIAYEIKENVVILTKANASVANDPFVTFDEWDSEADRKAYGKL